MATWDVDAETTHPVDFRLVQNAFVSMFGRTSLLDDIVEWLQSHAYRVVEFDASSWASDADMFDDVALSLSFPDYFGRNLDALRDCMGDVASGDYGWDPDATGLVIVLRAFDTFAAANRRTAQIMLDIVADRARCAILLGHRIICLVQSNDPALTFDPVGATSVAWNDAEWSRLKRGLS